MIRVFSACWPALVSVGVALGLSLAGCNPDSLTQGDRAFAARDWESAVWHYTGRTSPEDPDRLLRHAQALEAVGRVQEAAALIATLPAGRKDQAASLVVIRAQLGRGETDAALADARALVEANPASAAALSVLGEAEATNGDLEAAHTRFTAAVNLDASEARAWIGLGDVAFSRGDLAGARTAYERGVAAGGGGAVGVEARTRLARLLAAVGDADSSQLLLREAMSLMPRHPAAVAEFGKQLVRLGYPEQALDPLSDAQQALGEDADVMAYLGFCHLHRARRQVSWSGQVRDLQAAQMWFNRALARAPGRVDALDNLGQVYVMQGDLEAAEAAFRRAWELSPRSLDPLLNLGRLYADQGMVDRARAVFEQGSAVAPGNVILEMNLGVLALRQGDLDAAGQWLDRSAATCARTKPEHACHAELAFNRARLAGRRGDGGASAALLAEAVAFGFADLGRINAEPDLEAARADLPVANALDALRLGISD